VSKVIIHCLPLGIPVEAHFDSLWRSRRPVPPDLKGFCSKSICGGHSSGCTEGAKKLSPKEKSSRVTLHYAIQNDGACDSF